MHGPRKPALYVGASCYIRYIYIYISTASHLARPIPAAPVELYNIQDGVEFGLKGLYYIQARGEGVVWLQGGPIMYDDGFKTTRKPNFSVAELSRAIMGPSTKPNP